MSAILGIATRVDIDVHTISELNHRGGWRDRADRVSAQHRTVRSTLRLYERPTLPVRVRMTRCSFGELDDDNLRAALKAVRDAVARWLGVDDRDRRVMWQYDQERVDRGVHRVSLEFHPVRKEPTCS